MNVNRKPILYINRIIFGFLALIFLNVSSLFGQAFNHPGILNSRAELDFVKDKVRRGEQPWKQAFDGLKSSKYASLTYQPNPKATMDCWSYNKDKNGNYVVQCKTFVEDAMAAYSASLLWYLTEDKRYADKAIQIIDAWSNVYVDNTGSNARLNVSWATPWFTNAAEILRYGNSGGPSGWTNSGIQKFEGMLAKFLIKVNDDTMPGNNWIQSSIEAHFAIAIFTNNRTQFNIAVSRWKTRVKTYIYQKTDGPIPASFKSAAIDGIGMETARDLGHLKLGVNSMMYAAQSAYEQGVDLFSIEQKRLSDFFELHGSWMTGSVAVPSNVNGGLVKANEPDTYGIKPPSGGGGAAFEIAYNHLHTRLNKNLPYTQKMITQHRPAGIGQWVFKPETLTHGNLPFNLGNTSPTCSASIIASPSSFCAGGSILLTASPGNTYRWLNGTTQVGTSNTYNVTSAGTYSVEITNASGCKATSASKVINVLTPTTWYKDVDSDGKGDATQTQSSCVQPGGYVAVSGDACPLDKNKITAGVCGCGFVEGSCTNTAPSVQFTTPTNNATIEAPATLVVNASATDADGISGVQLFLNGVLVREEKTAPYDWNHNGQDIALQNMPVGNYVLKAIATDSKGAKGETSITINVKPLVVNPCAGATAPLVSISSPANNTSGSEGQSLTINAFASSTVSITSVEFFNGTRSIGMDNTAPYSVFLNSLTAGSYTFTAVAKNNCGGVTTSVPVNFIVKPVVVNSDIIIGAACASPNASLTYELNTGYRTNATGYSWWFTGSSQSVTPSTDGTSAKFQLSQYFTTGEVCVGVTISVAPFYKQYCKPVITCAAKIGNSEVEILNSPSSLVIYPNPNATENVMLDASGMNTMPSKLEIFNQVGEKVIEITDVKSINLLPTEGLSNGTYVVKTYQNQTVSVQKLVIIK